MRSATAKVIFDQDDRFESKSAGTDKSAATPLTKELLEWANTILVMEKTHRNYIRSHYPDIYDNKKIVCMYIPDDYDFMQPELISVLKDRVDELFLKGLIP
jgi:predicted protein tyrosine phosphatase